MDGVYDVGKGKSREGEDWSAGTRCSVSATIKEERRGLFRRALAGEGSRDSPRRHPFFFLSSPAREVDHEWSRGVCGKISVSKYVQGKPRAGLRTAMERGSSRASDREGETARDRRLICRDALLRFGDNRRGALQPLPEYVGG